ncbi:4-oxalocrotonate tautomerase family protein [Acidisoma cellulosilytica]|uniref:4-oxalocrotonate tautomerase family protein n=1 Tax=Acidisoma cellulosilyticum TaxID=2802395 RepID=A0A963Z5Y8_9PROT|nr:4-oxalocrotonate tautomerase family protein [Acidisoma cellulosilyticum]MCB8882477.1 4-oxalocrotonate tautomerase family protein [Acidisoma cellulosilyticum]
MPMITIRYTTPNPQPHLRPQIAALASQLAAEKLGKQPEVTAVLVESADPEGWFIAGQHPTAAGLSAFWLDIKITAGTNTKADTASFVKATYTEMEKLLGPLHTECYVLVQAVDGDAYGYGGRTQNGRWAEAHPSLPSNNDRLLRQF